MRKRIAALAVLAIGSSLLSAAPANAAPSLKIYTVPDSSYISTFYTDVAADRDIVDNLDNTFIVYTKQVNTAATVGTPAKGTLTLTGPDAGADWETPSFAHGDDDPDFSGGDFETTKVGTGVYALEVADDWASIGVSLAEDAASGTYKAVVKFGDAVSSVTYYVSNATGTGSYIAVRGDYAPTSGYGVKTYIEMQSNSDLSAGRPDSVIALNGPGVSFAADPADQNRCGSYKSVNTAKAISFGYNDGCYGGSSSQKGAVTAYSSDDEDYDPATDGPDMAYFDRDTESMTITTPYKGDVVISWHQIVGNATTATPYLSLTFTVGGAATMPADPVVTTSTAVTKVQSDLAAVTASVAALQTALASLVAATSATLATLAAKISKIMKKLKIK